MDKQLLEHDKVIVIISTLCYCPLVCIGQTNLFVLICNILITRLKLQPVLQQCQECFFNLFSVVIFSQMIDKF